MVAVGDGVRLAAPRSRRRFDGAALFEPAQRGVERPERHLPEPELAEGVLELVPVSRAFHEQSEDGEVEHDVGSVYRFDTYVYIESIYWDEL